jgi:hypothetical protein
VGTKPVSASALSAANTVSNLAHAISALPPASGPAALVPSHIPEASPLTLVSPLH